VTERLTLGTSVALAFTRSPMVTAQIAWDLARGTEGRFVLGLGTQVRAHIERRFGMPFSRPAHRLREYVLALRAIFAAFQGTAPLKFEGEFHSLTLLSDFFSPGPSPFVVPIHVGGANTGTATVAGEVCDGFHMHPLHSRRYLEKVILPAIGDGLRCSGRERASFTLCVPAFVVVGDTDEEQETMRAQVRRQIAFYGSTPAYRPVFEHHGWADVSAELKTFQQRGDIAGMIGCISEDILDAFATTASWDGLPKQLIDRYDGIADRLMPYSLGDGWSTNPEVGERWQAVATRLRGAA
jgi:probable F420-dependent oxidoreductase